MTFEGHFSYWKLFCSNFEKYGMYHLYTKLIITKLITTIELFLLL